MITVYVQGIAGFDLNISKTFKTICSFIQVSAVAIEVSTVVLQYYITDQSLNILTERGIITRLICLD